MDIQHRRLIRYIYGEAKKEGEEYRLGTEIQGDPPMITGAAALVARGRDTVLHTQHPDPRCCYAGVRGEGRRCGTRVRRSYPAPAADCLHCHAV